MQRSLRTTEQWAMSTTPMNLHLSSTDVAGRARLVSIMSIAIFDAPASGWRVSCSCHKPFSIVDSKTLQSLLLPGGNAFHFIKADSRRKSFSRCTSHNSSYTYISSSPFLTNGSPFPSSCTPCHQS